MSGIAKPLVHSTNTIGGDSNIVNIEEIVTVTKNVVLAGSSANGKDRFELIFSIKGHNNNPREMSWKFVDEATLDTDLAALKTLASNAL